MTSINASTPLSITRRPASLIFALLAVLTVGLLLLLPGGPVQAQATSDTYQYAEDRTDPVVTFTANDPEDVSPIVWSVLDSADNAAGTNGQDIDGDGGDDVVEDDIADRLLFSVNSNGALSFVSPPNFETPSGEGATPNTYKVVVQASDGGVTSWVNWFKVTVMVTDVEEAGTVTWTVDPDGADDGPVLQTLRQFRAGAALAATVTDLDNATETNNAGPVTGATWKWYRSSSNSGPWTEIFDAMTDGNYTASDEADSYDVGMYLRAVATYTDNRGGNKNAELVSLYPVQEAQEDNTHPEFPSDTATRSVNEGPIGRDVGGPVRASDADNDVLNYSIVDPTTGDAAFFMIDPATGQISTLLALNYEEPGDANEVNVFEVTVRATDSSGDATGDTEAPSDIVVMITVTDVNEVPQFEELASRPNGVDADLPWNTDGMAADHLEDTASLDIAFYSANDPEGGEITLSLSGADSDKFELNDLEPVLSGTQELAFKEVPDFENPGDSNEDNIYEVTVEASDTVMTASQSVTIKVTDADEDGEVTLFTQDAVVGRQLMATLDDSDGEVVRVSWQWETTTPEAGETCAAAAADATWGDIIEATAAAYTPLGSDNGDCLRVMAWYMDRTTTEVDTTDPADDNDPGDIELNPVRHINTAVSDTTTAVRDDPGNQAPMFVEGTATVRYVAENTDDEMNIGDPVVATDGDGDTPTYTLSGTDAAWFDIGAGSGQLMTKRPLNHEADNSYTVTVTADDSSGASNNTARISVAIRVVDLDEPPEITNVQEGVSHAVTLEHDENDPAMVGSFRAVDPEGVTPIVWSLLQEFDGNQDIPGYDDPVITATDDDVVETDIVDRGFFEISSAGVLTFESTPSWEDDSGSGDKNYQVVVQASDGGQSEMVNWFKVTVTINDVEEQGEVTWTVDPAGDGTIDADDLPQPLLEFRVGALLTATVTDPDETDDTPAPAGNVEWKWFRSSSSRTSGGSEILNETSNTYTASDDANNDDVNMYLRAEATYEDRRGGTRTVSFVSPNKVRGDIQQQNTAPELVSAPVASRNVNEASAGANAGGPVTGTDADKDVLNYVLSGTADDADFDIDQATGQITMVTALDYETPSDQDFADVTTVPPTDDAVNNNTYVVTVRAYDSTGVASQAVTILITVNDINEDPAFSATTPGPGIVAEHAEDDNFLIIGAPRINEAVDNANSTFAATDQEGATVTLTLAGDDKDKFEFVELSPSQTNSKMVAFKEKPDFEKPGDQGRNNIYEVTVVASDTVNEATRTVTVKVLDADEDGKVKLSTQDAVVGTEIVATLGDSDGDADVRERVERLSWQWQIGDVPAGGDMTCADVAAWEDITTAMASGYTPVPADNERCLRAMASYMDRTMTEVDSTPGDDDPADSTEGTIADVSRFLNTAFSPPTTKVRDDEENHAPEFGEAPATVRYVDENNVVTVAINIADPVLATDQDGDTVSYTLGGTDAASFEIVEDSGQLTTKMGVGLNHEAKDSYTVVVTARDNSGEANGSATITVTIRVMDLDEQPVISAVAAGAPAPANNAPAFAAGTDTREVAENTAAGRNIGAPVAATDADTGDTLTYTLGGADRVSFDINRATGQLMTRAALDHERKARYTVTVTASDGNTADDATITVTITVTDVVDGATTNTAPEFPATEDGARSVAENTGAGDNIGAPVAATDADTGDTLTYTLGGADAASFDIAPATGQLMTKAVLDHETTASYTVTVTAADAAGATDTITVTITVTDVDEPVIPGDANNDGMVDKGEVIEAFRAYVADPSDKPGMIAIFRQYVEDSQ